MKIGPFEIRLVGNAKCEMRNAKLQDVDIRNALAVPDTAPLWKAVHQMIDLAEAEALNDARRAVANDRLMLNSLGAADGAALVRSKLNSAREEGLRQRAENIQRSTLNAQ